MNLILMTMRNFKKKLDICKKRKKQKIKEW